MLNTNLNLQELSMTEAMEINGGCFRIGNYKWRSVNHYCGWFKKKFNCSTPTVPPTTPPDGDDEPEIGGAL